MIDLWGLIPAELGVRLQLLILSVLCGDRCFEIKCLSLRALVSEPLGGKGG